MPVTTAAARAANLARHEAAYQEYLNSYARKWVTRAAALALGVQPKTIERWHARARREGRL